MTEHNRILDELRAQGRRIGDPYLQEDKRGHTILFLVIDDVAMTVPQARRLAAGHATLEEISAEIAQLNATQ